jgi:hypothetical protein
VFYPEFKAFISWYGLKYPGHFTDEGKKMFNKMQGMSPDNYKAFRDAIGLMKGNPQICK